jgi:hypothetical protein
VNGRARALGYPTGKFDTATPPRQGRSATRHRGTAALRKVQRATWLTARGRLLTDWPLLPGLTHCQRSRFAEAAMGGKQSGRSHSTRG